MKWMKWINLATLALLIIGGLNVPAATIGGGDMDVVASAFGGADSDGARAFYGFVGLSALWQLIPFLRAWRLGEVDAEADRQLLQPRAVGQLTILEGLARFHAAGQRRRHGAVDILGEGGAQQGRAAALPVGEGQHGRIVAKRRQHRRAGGRAVDLVGNQREVVDIGQPQPDPARQQQRQSQSRQPTPHVDHPAAVPCVILFAASPTRKRLGGWPRRARRRRMSRRTGWGTSVTLRSFSTIRAQAAARKGGDAALAAQLPTMKTAAELAAIPDDRWLSMMSRCVFQAGFSWKVVENKWPGTEEAFWGFSPARCRAMSDEAFDVLLKDSRIIRNGAKVRSVQNNAALVMDLAAEYGSVGKAVGDWPADDYIGLLDLLKKRGDRLGGGAGMMALRFMGRDGWVTSPDMVKALAAEGVIDGAVDSQKSRKAIQAAFSQWAAEEGTPFAHISRILAMSVD